MPYPVGQLPPLEDVEQYQRAIAEAGKQLGTREARRSWRNQADAGRIEAYILAVVAYNALDQTGFDLDELAKIMENKIGIGYILQFLGTLGYLDTGDIAKITGRLAASLDSLDTAQ